MHLDNFASCTINLEQKDKGRQMSRYIPAGKTTERTASAGDEAEQRRQRDGMSANGKQDSRCTSRACLPAHKCQQSRTDVLDFDMAMFFTPFILWTSLHSVLEKVS